MHAADISTQEFTRARFRLRDDLIVTPQRYNNENHIHIESPLYSKFYRIGIPEYTFISLLDGQTTVAEAMTLTARTLGPDAFREQEAVAICRWLIETQLATNADLCADRIQTRQTEPRRKQSLLSRMNPFWMKLPLFKPNALLDRINNVFGWIHSPAAMVVWAIICGWALVTLLGSWGELTRSSRGVMSASNWVWLGVAWLGLKLLHEFAHGMVCKRYGGEVPEMGAIVILMAPMAYVDLTSAWRFRSKWQRIHTAVAGMYVELFVAAVALLLWSQTQSDELRQHLFNIVLLSSVTTLLFNANPLMRFDGYYVLSDLLEIPNLYAAGTTHATAIARRVFLGREGISTVQRTWQDLFCDVYGIAAFVWKIVICGSLLIAAATLFRGAGLILAAIGVLLWIAVPLARLGQQLAQTFAGEPQRMVRCGAVTAACVIALVGLAWGAPWPGGRSAPAFVEYAPLTVIRANTDGFVATVFVKEGQLVQQGDRLLLLENDELIAECLQLEFEIKQSHAKRRVYIQKDKIASAQIELKQIEALQQRLDERSRQRDHLMLTAPSSGLVAGRNLHELPGLFMKEGTELFTIGLEEAKEIQLSIAQADIGAFHANLNAAVHIRLPGHDVIIGKVDRLQPKASIEPGSDSLVAPNGGLLPVRVRESKDDDKNIYELIEPCFTGYVSLPKDAARSIPTGRRGLATLADSDRSFGRGLYDVTSHWIAQVAEQTGLR